MQMDHKYLFPEWYGISSVFNSKPEKQEHYFLTHKWLCSVVLEVLMPHWKYIISPWCLGDHGADLPGRDF